MHSGWVGGWVLDGWIDRWAGGRTNGRADGWMNWCMLQCIPVLLVNQLLNFDETVHGRLLSSQFSVSALGFVSAHCGTLATALCSASCSVVSLS